MFFPDHPNNLPTGSVIDGNALFRETRDEADYVIIGSGAAGGTAAQLLSDAGFSVIILEEGPWIRTHEFGTDVYPAMKTMFRNMGAQMATGRAPFPFIQGCCVGGSTTINSAIAWRAPEHVIDNWNLESITNKTLEEHFNALDKALTVKPVDDKALGNHNSLFGKAANKLGIQSQRIRRYDAGCDASASCLTGCRSGKKMAMNITFIPESLKKGAKIYHSSKVLRIGLDRIVHTSNLKISAKRGIVLAASAIQTPGILRRSQIRLKALGKHLQAHPGSSMIGQFEHDISMQTGATQGYNSTHFVESHGFKLETLSLQPELLSMRLPYVGPELKAHMANYKKILNWAVLVRAKARGEIKSFLGCDYISYNLTPSDMISMRDGHKKLTEMMFVAGATEVWPHVHGMPVLRSADDIKHWDTGSLDPRDYSMMASHLFGTTRMGQDPDNNVVDENFQVHGHPGVYVLDSGIFPSNLGINPQHTIMAVARLGASRLI